MDRINQNPTGSPISPSSSLSDPSAESHVVETAPRSPSLTSLRPASPSESIPSSDDGLQWEQMDDVPLYDDTAICMWDNCGMVFTLLPNLVEHIQSAHIGLQKPSYVCEWSACSRRGLPQTSRFALVSHIHSHTEKPYICHLPECDKSFTRSDALAKHLHQQHLGLGSISTETNLSLLQPSYDALSASSAQDPDCKCSPGTRKHVLEIIQSWFDNPNAERIFWCYGPVGAGKSALAQTVARTNVAATFFFFRTDPNRNDGNRLFTTLAWQLATSMPAIKDHISQSLNERPDLPRTSVETQFEELIVRPLLASNERTSEMRCPAPVVIIDGIDECTDQQLQQRILKATGTAVKNADFPLRFLITSRPEAHIEETIRCFEFPIARIDLASLDDVNTDVEYCLRFEFARIRAERGLDPIWPSQEIMQRLVFRAAGQFSYATAVIKLVGNPNNNAKTSLAIILGLEAPQIMPPFAILDQAYLEILRRGSDQDFLMAFLGLLVGRCSISRDGLSNDDAMLMNISRKELRKKLRHMCSILKFEPHIDPHYPSFLEFMQDASRSGPYYVSKNVGTRRYLELITQLLITRAARLTKHPDFHGTDHFTPEFGELIKCNPQAIELDVEDWEKILRPLQNVLDKLLAPPNVNPFKDEYCQQCRFFQITYDTLTHLKSLREREEPAVEKSVKSLEEIIRCGNRRQQNFNMNFGRHMFGSAVVVGIVLATLAHQR